MGFAENLRRYREQYGLLQTDIAKALKISDRTVGLWEREETMPRLDLAIKLAAYLGISLNDLVNDDEIFVMQVKEIDSSKTNRTEAFLSECRKFFEGSLSSDDLDEFFHSITEMYFAFKEKRKRDKI